MCLNRTVLSQVKLKAHAGRNEGFTRLEALESTVPGLLDCRRGQKSAETASSYLAE
jgi:hypothetical protein